MTEVAIAQLWGGILFLLQKVFVSISLRRDNKEEKRLWRIWAWSVYLVGLPAWILIFVWRQNWIAAGLEMAGVPSMLLGLTIALMRWDDKTPTPRWMDWTAYLVMVASCSYSVWYFGGLTFNQCLELAMVIGYLIGTYQLAKDVPSWCMWYTIMCVSNAILMYRGNYPWLVAQQIASIGFIVDSWVVQRSQKQKR